MNLQKLLSMAAITAILIGAIALGIRYLRGNGSTGAVTTSIGDQTGSSAADETETHTLNKPVVLHAVAEEPSPVHETPRMASPVNYDEYFLDSSAEPPLAPAPREFLPIPLPTQPHPR